MIEKVQNYIFSINPIKEKRNLTDTEKKVALIVLQDYFKDKEEDLTFFLDKLVLDPEQSSDGKLSIFTEETYDMAVTFFKSKYEAEFRLVKAEYLHSLLGMATREAYDYIEQIDHLKMAMKLTLAGKEIALSDIKLNCTKETLEDAKRDRDDYYEEWNRATDKIESFYRGDIDSACQREKEAYERAEKECRCIEQSLKLEEAGLLDEITIKSAISEYKKNYDNSDNRTRA